MARTSGAAIKMIGLTSPRSASLLVLPVAWLVVVAPGAQAAPPGGAAPDAGGSGAGVVTDRRELIVPAPAAEMVRIDNPLGRVEVRAWSRPGQIHIIAEKRAVSAEALERLRVHYTAWQSGEISIESRVELGGRERSLPLSGSRVDLIVEVPPELGIEAKTFGGDLSASGLRAGARLETTGGRIGVSDVRGGVVTRQLKGGQTVSAVDGDVDLDGVEGQMDLRGVRGGRLDARMVDGSIRAEDVGSALVRLTTTTGQIVLIGLLRPTSHYDLRSYAGDVRLIPVADSSGLAAGFELRTRSAFPVESAFAMRTLWRQGDRLHAQVVTRRPAAASGSRAGALVELSSVLGRVVIQPREIEPAPIQ
jgi:hypothetical protein